MISSSRAENLLRELGITEPQDIDLEAIACYVGARVKYRKLDGCEACIVGTESKAIISVDRRRLRRRQRFSIAHELGHWHHHRGRRLFCRSDEIGNPSEGASVAERAADAYAADLIMPRYLFDPVQQDYAKLTVKMIHEISDLFDVSLTATAIRIIEANHTPSILVCHRRDGRQWFKRSRDVPIRWFPQDALDPESSAFEFLHGDQEEQRHPSIIGADAWFDRQEAGRYEIHEQSMRIGDDETLTLLIISDAEMQEDYDIRSRRRHY